MHIPIKKIVLHRLQMKLNHPFSTSFGTVQNKDFFIIEVIDDKGIKGYGESVAFSEPWYTGETVETCAHMMEDFLIPSLRDNPISHPNDVHTLFSSIKKNNMAKSAIETAVWDLYAKRQGIPLHEALGGTRKQIEVGVSLGIEENIDLLLEKITHYNNQGYKRIKIKIKPVYDLGVLTKVREHFPEIVLMVDANSAYTINDIDHLRKFDPFNLLMIEQPLAEDDFIEHAILQKEIKTPICLDESIHSLADAKVAVKLQSCKVINIKSGRVGGLTAAKEIHNYCAEHEIDVWCGGMLEAGVGRAHNIALATLSNFTLPGDISGSSHYFKEDIITPEVTVENGTIPAPDGIGISYEVNQELLKKYQVNKTEFLF